MLSCSAAHRTTGTFVSVCVLCMCEAARSCGRVQCGAGQHCCPPTVPGNGSSAAGCCKHAIHVFFENVGWFSRKLSGLLILLVLFIIGYFIQRIICPRPRRPPHIEEPRLFHGHVSASQDALLEADNHIRDFASPSLPTYDEVKYLPTYEESLQEVLRGRSQDTLL